MGIGKSDGSHLLIELLSKIFTEDLKNMRVTLNHSLRLLTRLYKYNKYTKH